MPALDSIFHGINAKTQGVNLGFKGIKPLIHCIKPLVHRVEPFVYRIELAAYFQTHLFKPFIDPLKLLLDVFKRLMRRKSEISEICLNGIQLLFDLVRHSESSIHA